MNMYGWNNEMSTTLLEHNLNDKISRSWWLSLLFFIGMFMYKLPDAWVTVAAFLPPKVQQQLAKITHHILMRIWILHQKNLLTQSYLETKQEKQ